MNFTSYVRTVASRGASFAHSFAVLRHFKTKMATPQTTNLSEAFSKLKINDEDHEIIESLIKLSVRLPKLVKSTAYDAPADPKILIRSWKMNEYKYYDIPSPFPTLARGLFTRDIPVDGQVKHRIVARGYDKFFNIGEVPWTTVRHKHVLLCRLASLLIKCSGLLSRHTPSRLTR